MKEGWVVQEAIQHRIFPPPPYPRPSRSMPSPGEGGGLSVLNQLLWRAQNVSISGQFYLTNFCYLIQKLLFESGGAKTSKWQSCPGGLHRRLHCVILSIHRIGEMPTSPKKADFPFHLSLPLSVGNVRVSTIVGTHIPTCGVGEV